VKASITDEDAFHNQKPLVNDMTELDESDYTASFKGMKVNISTRMNPIHLKFSCTVKDSKEETTIKSTQTGPIIVITNESQWGEAAGKILSLDVFGGQPVVTWPQYVNTLHNHLFRATAQIPKDPVRCFTDSELLYIQERFFENKSKITNKEAAKCWNWLGQVLTTIRFKRHIRTLWFDGLVYGLISKKECNRILRKEENGTFLIRFSDSVPGSFAVAYATDDMTNRIKHYLVKPEDIGANKALPDFLREKKLFHTLVQLDLANGSVRKLNKEAAFQNFYSKKYGNKPQPEADTHGYVQNLEMET